MRASQLFVSLLLLTFALIVGCSGLPGGGGPPPPPGPTTVSVAVTDTPPAGVTVISFQVNITGATLNPAGGGTPVNLLPGGNPVQVEVKRLETEAAFLSTTNVAAGTYNSITLAFATPRLTIKNDSAAPQLGCAVGAVCELTPAAAGAPTFSAAPFPVTISASTPTGFLVDINLNNILTSAGGVIGVDFNATNGLTVLQLPRPGQPTGQLELIEDLLGIVAGKDAVNNQFTLQTTQGNFTVKVDSTTVFNGFTGCAASDFTCVQNGQVVDTDLRLQTAGTFLAKMVELEDAAADDEVEGVIFSVDSPTQFRIVAVQELRDVIGVAVGNPATVTLQANPSFQVDTRGLTIPAGLLANFQNATTTAQLLPGQAVQVRIRGTITPGPPIAFQTDRVRLRMSRFTATVAGAPAPFLFNVSGLPVLFTTAGITQIQVQTSSQTIFEGVTDVTGLADGNTVSLRGPLFNAPPNFVLIASKVRKR